MNLGIRGHDIASSSLDELVRRIASKGFTSVQLALSKSLPQINTELGSLSPGLAHHIGDKFQKQAIQIAVLGCYINMIHPDLAKRRNSLERFKEHIRFARDFGCSIVGTETGNVLGKGGYTEENFKEKPFLDVVESVKELVAEAEKFGVIVGIEAGMNHPIYSVQTMKRLLDCVDSNNLQVIFDPMNLLTIKNYEIQEEIFAEALEVLGDRIVIIHAKDFIVENGSFKQVEVGKGLLNYEMLFPLIKAKKPHIHILMEGTKEPYIDEAAAYLRAKYEGRRLSSC
ncbi:sugar phosphate isomerase/epimerase family protein [Ferdinandcohnia quinoae]|uniref:Sugar phosphate isomerase/epimerase n=1 Tax=Fredinandcohnia quinoae TaxID=2918902 RepID=A0AAW5DXP3_9BACI|nr:sugar phosphate isomerase/epimerase [Fredinandcohnia sp. SECRCQ15]MCH1625442.1 sugar phosphate isomerase/epimerase [Fredinandcohnia sp. SECRCQ15]